jgi:hypothetical protein
LVAADSMTKGPVAFARNRRKSAVSALRAHFSGKCGPCKNRGTVTRKLSYLVFSQGASTDLTGDAIGSALPLPDPPHPNRLSEIVALCSLYELLLRCSSLY